MVGRGMLVPAISALAAALIVALFYGAPPGMAAASGTSIVVNTKEDVASADGDCSLREAIQAANTNAAVDGCAAGSSTDRDAIRFSLGKRATITLQSQLHITDGAGLTVKGGKAKITVSGNDSVRVFWVDRGAKLTLNKLKVAKGRAVEGGGIYNFGSTLKVTNSTISGNSAYSGSSAYAQGGGIYTVGGTVTVIKSTISGNSATSAAGSNNTPTGLGGGIYSSGTLNITNSTISGNSANRQGGGIFNELTLKATNSTISGNSASSAGGGLINSNYGAATLKNTIVANSPSGGNCLNYFGGTQTDGGYNIEDGTSCGFSAANNSLPSTEPLLRELANNGGPTKTHALRDISPAVNLMPNGTNGCGTGTEVSRDQRGVKRPQGRKCDVGSFEREL